MKRHYLTLLLPLFLLLNLKPERVVAQLSGISYHFVPTAEYFFPHKNSGIANGTAWGGQFGFGFGEYMSLSAIYLKSAGLTTDFGRMEGVLTSPADRDASLERYGGELQANFSRRRLVPFLALGTGIQGVSAEGTEKSRQIYLSAGTGLAFHLHDRINIGVQLLNTSYRINPFAAYLTPAERIGWPGQTNRVSDWSVKGRFSLLLGGERTGELSEIDLAFRDQFSGGLKGLSVQLEPAAVFVNFDESLPFYDSWYAGLSAGCDFGPFVGIRAFYLHALDEDNLGSLNKSTIWGGETRFRLNRAQGLVPYVTLGGGRINALDGYTAPRGLVPENKVFASGGLGLELPLARRLKLMAFANGMLTTMQDQTNLTEPEDIVTSMAYGVKLGFSIGKKPEDGEALLKERIQSIRQEYTEKQSTQLNRVVSDYETLLEEKNAQLAQREALIDSLMVEPEKEQADTTELRKTTGAREAGSIIQMTPDELVAVLQALRMVNVPDPLPPARSSVIEAPEPAKERVETEALDILPMRHTESLAEDHTPSEPEAAVEAGAGADSLAVEDPDVSKDTVWVKSPSDIQDSLLIIMTRSMARVEESMNQLQGKIDRLSSESPRDGVASNALMQELVIRMEKVDRMVDALATEMGGGRKSEQNLNRIAKDVSATQKEIRRLSGRMQDLQKAIDRSSKQKDLPQPAAVDEDQSEEFISDTLSAVPKGIHYSNMAVFGGINAGDIFSFNLGLRWSYPLSDTQFRLVPEAFAGFGKRADLGLSLNGVYDIQLRPVRWTPYVGAGVGFITVHENDDPFKGVVNLMIGASLPNVADGIYIDFTTRNFFRYNQISVGYTLPF